MGEGLEKRWKRERERRAKKKEDLNGNVERLWWLIMIFIFIGVVLSVMRLITDV